MRSSANSHLKLHQVSLEQYEAQYGIPQALESGDLNANSNQHTEATEETSNPISEKLSVGLLSFTHNLDLKHFYRIHLVIVPSSHCQVSVVEGMFLGLTAQM